MTEALPTGARDWLGADGGIARRLDGFEHRTEQVVLAEAIERALGEGRHLLAEAGTGIGKSFAYLLPAVLHAMRHPDRGPVIVSTRTIALQEQLEHKDLPFLQSVLPIEFAAVAAVGRNHYLCLRRMRLAQRERAALFDDPRLERDLLRVVEWSATSRDGLRFELTEPIDDRVWEETRAEHGNCLHKACPHYDVCGYQRSRRRLDSAQIVVVNHALYMSDVALRMAGARYLPDHRVVVFDEAHHLERVATESLGLRVTLGTVLWHIRRLDPSGARRSLLREHGSSRAVVLTEQVRLGSNTLFDDLAHRCGSAGSGTVAIGRDEAIEEHVTEVLRELADEIVVCAAGVEPVDLKMELQARARGLNGLALTLEALCRPAAANHDSVETVRWIEQQSRSVALRSAPLEVDAALREFVFASPRTAILLSATLGPSRDRDFATTRAQLGIADADTLRLGSPFDYRANVVVHIAEGMPDPGRDPSGYQRGCELEVCERVTRNGGRALVLCTSWGMVRSLAEALRGALGLTVPILVQGEAPNRELLRRKREEPESVLIGTDSFWEGIDVPGEALTLVIVTKLPFSPPDHPLTRARHQAIADRGGDPFAERSLPEAILRFRQGFGRLIRSTADHGQVVILDPRLRTRRYGWDFLSSLPDGALEGGASTPAG